MLQTGAVVFNDTTAWGICALIDSALIPVFLLWLNYCFGRYIIVQIITRGKDYMGLSLQDQLLKSGLADKKQAKKANQEKRVKRKKNKGKAPAPEINQTRQEQLASAKRSQELNRKANLEKQKHEKLAQVRQLIEKNQLDLRKYEDPYYFKVGRKIKKLYVNQEITQKLGQGQLAIVTLNSLYQVVPANVARQIAKRDPDSVVVLYKEEEQEQSST